MRTTPHAKLYRPRRLVLSSRRAAFVAWALGIVFVLGPVALAMVPWQQNIRAPGRVTAYAPVERQQSIEAPIDGRLVQWWVQEGSEVSAGDPLVEISDIDPELVNRLTQEKHALQAKLDACLEKLHSYEQQVINLAATRHLAVAAAAFYVETGRQKVLAASAAREAAAATLRAAEAQYARNQSLLAEGIVSRREFELAERDLEVAKTSHQSTEASSRRWKPTWREPGPTLSRGWTRPGRR